MQFGMAFRWVIASVDGSCSTSVETNRQGWEEERGQHRGRRIGHARAFLSDPGDCGGNRFSRHFSVDHSPDMQRIGVF